jgi:hypothetical protein
VTIAFRAVSSAWSERGTSPHGALAKVRAVLPERALWEKKEGVKSAREWKAFYLRERDELGDAGLAALLDRAPSVDLPARGALLFPHTRLATSGELAAAVALAVVRAGREEVVALGILHGGRHVDADLVRRAREGAPQARAAMRRVHGPEIAGDEGRWAEEFSLDGFCALVKAAAAREGRRAPKVHLRYPFLVGETPGDVPGAAELRARIDAGAALVATADPIHHGAGYGAREEDRLAREDPQTLEFARWTIERGFQMLAARDYGGFARHAVEVRSDFRDTGPMMAWLVDPSKPLDVEILELRLVDYSEALGAPPPTWVAGALARFTART